MVEMLVGKMRITASLMNRVARFFSVTVEQTERKLNEVMLVF